ncbi:MAG TPA: AIR synthase-related protein, partial [Candidatus Saccharimonadales bacterium]|nr:AIR synthase-related protein [Candidatus Saccharimonadales bacterium]
NPVGIPTNNGSFHFHKDFRAKPTVAAGAYGIIPKSRAKIGIPKKGDLIITIGGRTGRDGIHGATFSSGEMTNRTINTSGSSVQIGNPIEEIRIIDATLELSDKGLIRAITDCGAGGYSSAIGEMAKNVGAVVDLEKVPLKYAGLSPWEIFLSESQERMVLAISPGNLKKVLSICKEYNVEAAVLGKFDGKKRLVLRYNNKLVCDIDMKFLHDGLPQRKMVGKTRPRHPELVSGSKLPSKDTNIEKSWLQIMSHGNICSKEPVVRMYDHTVQGTNALTPFGGKDQDSPNDGAIVRPFPNKPYGLVITHGLNPQLNLIDPYLGSVWAILESVSNYVAIGGSLKDAALVDNFIWPFPDEESLADLDKAVDACVDMSKILNMPFVSGKDSLSSTYRYPDGKTLKIPPVLLISTYGKIPDVTKTASSDFKKKNSTIVLVGKPDMNSMGGTTYYENLNLESPMVPKADLKTVANVLNSITSSVQEQKALAVHDISEGGLAVTLAEMCFGGDMGASIDVSKVSNDRPDLILFSETPATFLVEVENEKTAKELFAKVPHTIIGKTETEKNIKVTSGKQEICKMDLNQLKTIWQKPMKELFHSEA